MRKFFGKKVFLFGGLGVGLALFAYWMAGAKLDALFFILSAIPLVGMATINGPNMADLAKQFAMAGNGPAGAAMSSGPKSPAWLFWVKAFGDLTMKAFLGLFHLYILSSAMPFTEPFEELAVIGDLAFAVGAGSLNLGLIMALALTLVFLLTPAGGWYLYLTKYDGPMFWKRDSPDRMILGSILVLYGALLVMELAILGQNIVDVTTPDAGPFGVLVDAEDRPPSPFIMGGLSFLVTMLGVVMGYVTARLVLDVEERKYDL